MSHRIIIAILATSLASCYVQPANPPVASPSQPAPSEPTEPVPTPAPVPATASLSVVLSSQSTAFGSTVSVSIKNSGALDFRYHAPFTSSDCRKLPFEISLAAGGGHRYHANVAQFSHRCMSVTVPAKNFVIPAGGQLQIGTINTAALFAHSPGASARPLKTAKLPLGNYTVQIWLRHAPSQGVATAPLHVHAKLQSPPPPAVVYEAVTKNFSGGQVISRVTIAANGQFSFMNNGKVGGGRLPVATLRDLRRSIRATDVRAITPRIVCKALPSTTTTVTANGRSARFVNRCGANPTDSLRALMRQIAASIGI